MLNDLIGGALEGASDMVGCLLVMGGAAFLLLALIGLLSRIFS